jgi:NAD(P) transhydrogenase subunit alpha
MSATNAVSGITVIGALAVCAVSVKGTPGMILSFIAVILASINVVGGYMVTGRMLGMFRKKKGDKD